MSTTRCLQICYNTYHWHLEEGDELKEMTNRSQVLVPSRDIVTQPVPDIAASTNKGTASDDHGALVRASLEHTVTTDFAHHCSVQVVSIVLGPASTVNEISLGSLITETARCIIDSVSREEKVSVWQPLLIAVVLSACQATSLGRCSLILVARKVAETGGLIHVDPKRVNVNSCVFVEEAGEFVVPVALCVLGKPIRKDGCAWPYFTFPRYTRIGLEESIRLNTPVIRTIVLGSDS